MKRLNYRLGGLALLAFLTGTLEWLNREVPKVVLSQPSATPTVEVSVGADIVFFEVSSVPPLPSGLPVRLTLATPAGPVVTETLTTDEALRLELPYVRAGRTPYRLSVGEHVLEGVFDKAPGPPVTPLTLAIGARAARVTGDHDPALVIHPLDAQQNVSALPVVVTALYPDGERWQRSTNVEYLLAWTFIPTGQQVGTLKVSAVSSGARGQRGEVDLLPGDVTSATFAAPTDTALASGRDVWRLELAGATDANGNRALDGAAATFVGGGGERDFYLTRPLIQGAQPLVLLSLPEAGAYELAALAGEYRSEVVPLSATPLDVAELPLGWRTLTPLVLELGPVLDTSGALVDDGTLVHLTLQRLGEPAARFSEPLQDGRLHWQVPPLPDGAERLNIQIGNRRDTLDLPGRPYP